MPRINHVIISPVRNEAAFLDTTIHSVSNQTILPAKWVIVDDGSTDNTGEIAQAAADRHSWISVVRRKDRGFRQSGIGVVEAFYDGFSLVQNLQWEYLTKLDGDVRLPPDYFEDLFRRFEVQDNLGICSGDIFTETADGLVLDSPGDPSFHVRGAAKIYRRACWDAIGGIPRVTGFDCIDNVKARMLGWDTRRFNPPAVIHLRRTGAANGVWRNSLKDGIGARAIGYHPLFLALKCVKRFARGAPVGALGQLCGYIKGSFIDVPRIKERELIRYVRRQQINRLLGRESIWR